MGVSMNRLPFSSIRITPPLSAKSKNNLHIFAPKVIGMNVFSAFDTGVMVALLLGIEFLRSDIRTILYCKMNDPMILKSCLYTLLILLTSLYSIVAGAMLPSGARTCL